MYEIALGAIGQRLDESMVETIGLPKMTSRFRDAVV